MVVSPLIAKLANGDAAAAASAAAATSSLELRPSSPRIVVVVMSRMTARLFCISKRKEPRFFLSFLKKKVKKFPSFSTKSLLSLSFPSLPLPQKRESVASAFSSSLYLLQDLSSLSLAAHIESAIAGEREREKKEREAEELLPAGFEKKFVSSPSTSSPQPLLPLQPPSFRYLHWHQGEQSFSSFHKSRARLALTLHYRVKKTTSMLEERARRGWHAR